MAQTGFLIPPGTSSEELANRRRLAQTLLQSGMDYSPVGHWTQGAARLAQSLVGGMQLRNMRDDAAQERQEGQRLLGEALGIGTPQTSSAPPQRGPSTSSPRSGSLTDRIVSAESGGNATATNPRSSATGAGQFINSTWLDMIKRNRPDLAQGKTDQQLLAMRTDPELSRQMVDAYAAENAASLSKAGFEPTDGMTYLAHFAGPAGARAILRADARAPVAKVLGQNVVQANPFLANMTAGDLIAWADRKVAGGGAAPAADPDQPTPVTTTTIDPTTGNVAQPTSNSPLGVDPNTAQLIQKLSMNRYTAPLANQLLSAALTPKSPKDRYVSTGGGIFDTQTQQWMMPPAKETAPTYEATKYGVIRKDTGEITPYDESNLPAEDRSKQAEFEQKLRKEYSQLSKDYREVRDGLDRVRAGAQLNTGAGDVATVFGYMKTLDPSSTVREGEFATAEQTSGLPGQVVSIYNRIVSGERLTPEQRQNFVSAAEALAQSKFQEQQRIEAQFGRISEAAGADPTRVITDFGQTPGATPPPPSDQGNKTDPSTLSDDELLQKLGVSR